MTKKRMALLEFIEKGADAYLVVELTTFATERTMTAEVDELTGVLGCVRRTERVDRRNGYRERGCEIRVGRVDLAITKLRT